MFIFGNASGSNDRGISRHDIHGNFIDFVVEPSQANSGFSSFTIGNGNIFVINDGDQVLRYDVSTGQFLGSFLLGGGTGLIGNVVFGPDGDLYVTRRLSFSVYTLKQYDGDTGIFLRDIIELDDPRELRFSPDNSDLFVSQWSGAANTNNCLTRVHIDFDGQTDDQIVSSLIISDLDTAFTFGPGVGGEMHIYVSKRDFGSFGGMSTRRYTQDFQFLQIWLDNVRADFLAFAPTNKFYFVNQTDRQLDAYDASTSNFLGPIIEDFTVRDLEFFGPLIGDLNQDGVIDLLDVQSFVDALVSGTFVEEADINRDGEVNLLDIAPFVDLLNGCP